MQFVGKKELQTNVWKIRKNARVSSNQATSFRLHEYSLLCSILMFHENVKLDFGKCYGMCHWISVLHVTLISDHFAYPSRWLGKPR